MSLPPRQQTRLSAPPFGLPFGMELGSDGTKIMINSLSAAKILNYFFQKPSWTSQTTRSSGETSNTLHFLQQELLQQGLVGMFKLY